MSNLKSSAVEIRRIANSIMAEARAPKRSVSAMREDIIDKLLELGMRNLGDRSGKAGTQFGASDESGRRIAVGSRDVMTNYILVEQQGYGFDKSYPKQSSRWNMSKSWLISGIASEEDYKTLKAIVEWAKRGPDMKEVRQVCREEFDEQFEKNKSNGVDGYEGCSAVALGSMKWPR